MTTHGEWTAAQDRADVSVDGHDLEVAYYEGGDPAGDRTDAYRNELHDYLA